MGVISQSYCLAYKEGSDIAREVVNPTEWLLNDGVLATAFPVVRDCGFGMFNEITPFSLKNDAVRTHIGAEPHETIILQMSAICRPVSKANKPLF